MILKKVIKSFRYQKPIVTGLLLISCLITTIPQFFLNGTYNQITGSPFLNKLYWCFTLTSFSHSPGMLFTHLIGNLLVLITFGIVIETIIGSNEFAFISLITLIGTTVLDILHGTGISHGASGIFWGYHLLVLFIIVILFENSKNKIVQDIYFWICLVLFIFDFIIISIFEVTILHRRFFENFGQTIHLFSIVLLIPYVLIKRNELNKNVLLLLDNEQIIYRKKRISIIILCIILVLNLSATIFAIYKTNTIYTIEPRLTTPINEIDTEIRIKYTEPMIPNTETNTRYDITTNEKEIKWITKWVSNNEMVIELSRKPEKDEKIVLEYEVKNKDGLIRYVKVIYK